MLILYMLKDYNCRILNSIQYATEYKDNIDHVG